MWTAAVLALLPASVQTADTVVVRADNPPEWGEAVQLVEELRIGSLDGAEEEIFGRITGVAIGPERTVYVADEQVPVIRQFAADGSWIRNIGRQGEGPGEYNSILGIRGLYGRTLRILDQRNRRVTTYQNFEYHASFRSGSGYYGYDAFAVDTAGTTYVKAVLRDRSAPRVSGAEWDFGWVRIDVEGEVLDTLHVPAADEVGGGFVLSGKGGYYRPFTIMTLSTVSPHGYLLTVRNDQYAIHRPLPDGRVLRIERDAEPVPVKPEEKAQWEDWLDYSEVVAEDMGEQNRKLGPIPDTKPLIRDLMTDDDGRIWVAVYAEARFKPYSDAERAERGDRPSLEWNQPLAWEVLDGGGRFLGRLTLPDKTSLLAARGTTVWGSQVGTYGEEYVVRFKIERD
jgi:hypothetical protein